MRLNLNLSYKHHCLIAILISVWLVVFLVIIAPFDIAQLPLLARLELMPLYGFITFAGYMVIIPIQNWIFLKMERWTLSFEIAFLLLFNVIVLVGNFMYYKSDLLNGAYSFRKFSLEVYYPTFFLLLSVLIILRWILFKKKQRGDNRTIVLRGDNKLDALQLSLSALVYVASADNYVEISYLKQGTLHKKLLRNTLKSVEEKEPNLLRVHRSFLINPRHFIEWKNAGTIILSHAEVPVAKSYRDDVRAALSHP